MSKIRLISVGKLKERFYVEGCLEYSKRLERYCRFSQVELPDEKAPEILSQKEQQQVTEREGRRILEQIKPQEHVVALCIGGKSYDSVELATHMGRLLDEGKELCFVIGGSLGLSEQVLKRADEGLSLGRLTLPHRLARLVFLEQLFRCFTILKNQPYHK